jgi:hypothetical protein
MELPKLVLISFIPTSRASWPHALDILPSCPKLIQKKGKEKRKILAVGVNAPMYKAKPI